jgi:thioredoxin-like negative regulator of GroEL
MLTEATNQIPTTLLFRNGTLIDRRLGAQTFEALREWVAEAADR